MSHPAFRWLIVYLLASALVYGGLTHWPRVPPELLLPGALDSAIPLLPWSVPLYMSYLLLMPVLVWLGVRDQRRGRSELPKDWLLPAFFAGALATGLCLLSHLLWPTVIERPLPGADDTLLRWLYLGDAPLAASPCGHTALPLALALILACLRVRWARLFAAWTALLSVAVLTTKQHLVGDVLAGYLFGVFAAAVTLALQRAAVELRTIGAVLLEYGVIIATLSIALSWRNPWILASAFVIIATRQHALFVLYHDATHRLWCRHGRINDVLVNFFVGLPQLLPIEVYRPLHLDHHRHLGTPQDPESRYLFHAQVWRYRPLPLPLLGMQLAGDLLLLNNLRSARAYLAERGAAALAPSLALVIAALPWLGIGLWLLLNLDAGTLVVLALLWFGPLLTVTNLLQKLRSYAEHSGGPEVSPDWPAWTYSWRVGWLGRATVWPYHINLHQQHHANAAIPWHGLPQLLQPTAPQLNSTRLPRLLWARRQR